MVFRTLEIDSGHRNKKVGFYPKFVKALMRILCVFDDSHVYMEKELLVRSARTLSAPSVRLARNYRPLNYTENGSDRTPENLISNLFRSNQITIVVTPFRFD